MDELKLKEIVAKNIIHYRKALNFTQAELAEKLCYSDKAISKWERAEAIPDVFILKLLSNLFGITLDEITSEHTFKKIKTIPGVRRKKIIIPLMSAGLVWLIATVCFVFLTIFDTPIENTWLAFIYPVPISLIIFIVFNAIWGQKILSPIFASALLWSIILSLFLSLNFENDYLIFIAAVPIQILLALWYTMTIMPKRKAQKNSQKENTPKN